MVTLYIYYNNIKNKQYVCRLTGMIMENKTES